MLLALPRGKRLFEAQVARLLDKIAMAGFGRRGIRSHNLVSLGAETVAQHAGEHLHVSAEQGQQRTSRNRVLELRVLAGCLRELCKRDVQRAAVARGITVDQNATARLELTEVTLDQRRIKDHENIRSISIGRLRPVRHPDSGGVVAAADSRHHVL